jgi:hypothetical protein
MKSFKQFVKESSGVELVDEDWKKKAATAALAGSMALSAVGAHSSNLGHLAHSVKGAVSSAVSKNVDKKRNAADMEFAKKIPHQADREKHIKEVESIIRSRSLRHGSPAFMGANAVHEKRFKKSQDEMSKKHNIPIPVKEEVELDEASAAWQRKEGKNPSGGLNKKGIASYRRENPGSKLSMAVTTKPSKLKKGSKAWNRRKSFCARMGGMPGPMKDEKGRPTRKALSLRKWNC